MDSIFSWQTVWYLILILYIPASIGLIVVVLLQKGKGVGFAGAFGMGGGSDTIFGPRAAKSVPQRLTYLMAGLFMFLALVMSLIAGRISTGVAPAPVDESAADYSVLEDLGAAVEGGVPESAAPGAPAVKPPAEGATVEKATTEEGKPIPPTVYAPEVPESNPAQGTPPAVPVPPETPPLPAPVEK